MRNETRLKFNALAEQIAKLNGVPLATEKFTVEPSVQQTLETRLQEKSDFLKRINIVGVTEMKGEKLGLGIGGPIASTTNTATTDRETKDPTSLDKQTYLCEQINYDTHLTYGKLDAWAKFPDFQPRVRDVVLQRQALDRILIGFNGTSRAATSDPVANPLLQDVAKGWLQQYRDNAPERVLDEGAAGGGATIKVGPVDGADYKNLDALVFSAVNELIDPWHQEDTQLVVICGRKILQDKYFPLVNDTTAPTEKLAADLIISQKRLGGLQAVRVPHFPDDTLFITRLDNLSIYYQEGARRRAVTDNPKRDRIENWESSNDAFVVEDFGCGCLIENIELVEPVPAP